MDRKYKVGGYVKLAKLWERSKDVAVAYHSSYYAERFRDDVDKRLVGVYILITFSRPFWNCSPHQYVFSNSYPAVRCIGQRKPLRSELHS